jgi:hypothetical protein
MSIQATGRWVSTLAFGQGRLAGVAIVSAEVKREAPKGCGSEMD